MPRKAFLVALASVYDTWRYVQFLASAQPGEVSQEELESTCRHANTMEATMQAMRSEHLFQQQQQQLQRWTVNLTSPSPQLSQIGEASPC